jgi:TolB protein
MRILKLILFIVLIFASCKKNPTEIVNNNIYKIAFTIVPGGHENLNIINSDGSNHQLLYENPNSDVWYPNWSPDGSKIVFYTDNRLFTIDIETKSIKQLTNEYSNTLIHAYWSPLGNRIAFRVTQDGLGVINLMDTDGNNIQELVKDKGVWEVSWSPDGRQISYIRYTAIDKHEIIITGVDDSTRQVLTEGEDHCWSPDGRKICYFYSGELYYIDVYNKNIEQLTHNDKIKHNPQWSPDGSKILYGSLNQTNDDEIKIINVNDRSNVQFPNIVFGYYAQWSPDGKTILFESWDIQFEIYKLYLMNANGKNIRRLTRLNNHDYERYAVWSPK